MRYGKRAKVLVVLTILFIATPVLDPAALAQVRLAVHPGRPAAGQAQGVPTRVPRRRDFAPALLSGFTENFGTASHGAGFVTSLTISNNGSTVGGAAGDSIIVTLATGSGRRPGPLPAPTRRATPTPSTWTFRPLRPPRA